MASTRKNRTPDPAVLERIKSDMREAHINGEEFPGKYFELAIAHMLMTYVNNMDPSGVPAGKDPNAESQVIAVWSKRDDPPVAIFLGQGHLVRGRDQGHVVLAGESRREV